MKKIDYLLPTVFIIGVIIALVFSFNSQKVLLSPPGNSICQQLSCKAPYSGFGFASEVTD